MTDIRNLTLTRSLLLSLALGLLGINLLVRPAEVNPDNWRKSAAAKVEDWQPAATLISLKWV